MIQKNRLTRLVLVLLFFTRCSQEGRKNRIEEYLTSKNYDPSSYNKELHKILTNDYRWAGFSSKPCSYSHLNQISSQKEFNRLKKLPGKKLIAITIKGYASLCFTNRWISELIERSGGAIKSDSVWVIDYLKNRWIKGLLDLDRFPKFHFYQGGALQEHHSFNELGGVDEFVRFGRAFFKGYSNFILKVNQTNKFFEEQEDLGKKSDNLAVDRGGEVKVLCLISSKDLEENTEDKNAFFELVRHRYPLKEFKFGLFLNHKDSQPDRIKTGIEYQAKNILFLQVGKGAEIQSIYFSDLKFESEHESLISTLQQLVRPLFTEYTKKNLDFLKNSKQLTHLKTFVILTNSLQLGFNKESFSKAPQELNNVNRIMRRLALKYYNSVAFVWTDGLYNPAKKVILGHELNLKFPVAAISNLQESPLGVDSKDSPVKELKIPYPEDQSLQDEKELSHFFDQKVLRQSLEQIQNGLTKVSVFEKIFRENRWLKELKLAKELSEKGNIVYLIFHQELIRGDKINRVEKTILDLLQLVEYYVRRVGMLYQRMSSQKFSFRVLEKRYIKKLNFGVNSSERRNISLVVQKNGSLLKKITFWGNDLSNCAFTPPFFRDETHHLQFLECLNQHLRQELGFVAPFESFMVPEEVQQKYFDQRALLLKNSLPSSKHTETSILYSLWNLIYNSIQSDPLLNEIYLK